MKNRISNSDIPGYCLFTYQKTRDCPKSDVQNEWHTWLMNCVLMFMMKNWISGQPWVNVKAKVRKDYPSVQYTAWTVIFLFQV